MNRFRIRSRLGGALICAAMAAQAQPGEGAVPGEGPQPVPILSDNAVRRAFYFPSVDVRAAFKALAMAGGVDVVLSPKVEGRVNLTLTNKTWDEALQVVCQMLGLQYTLEKKYIYVQTSEEVSANLKEADLVRDIIPVHHSKAADLKSAVEGLLSPRGAVTVVSRTNALIVADIRRKVDEARRAIELLDVETLQIHIQAQILEVNSSAAQELGVNWQAGQGPVDELRSAGGLGVDPDPTVPKASAMSGLATSSPGRVAGSSFSLGLGLLDGNLGVAVDYLLTEGKGEIVAKPQITTMDNSQARIFIGKRVPYNKLDDQFNSTTEFVEAGTELVVTPHVTHDRRIILDLAPQRSDASIDPVTRGPIISTQEAKTTVVVDDGQTVVIGGLTLKKEEKVERGLPILKDIPLLGYLFKYERKETTKQDLIIFITPHIITGQYAIKGPQEGAGAEAPAQAPGGTDDGIAEDGGSADPTR